MRIATWESKYKPHSHRPLLDSCTAHCTTAEITVSPLSNKLDKDRQLSCQ